MEATTLHAAGLAQPEPHRLLFAGEDFAHLPACGEHDAAQRRERMLVRVLRDDRLTSNDVDAIAVELDVLIARRDQAHLDPRLPLVPDRTVLERVDVELRA